MEVPCNEFGMTLNGYRGKALDLLQKYEIEIGDQVCVDTIQGSIYCGIILPRYENANPERITIKLENGYNTGISIHKIRNITKVNTASASKTSSGANFRNESYSKDATIDDRLDARGPGETDNLEPVHAPESLPNVSLISTGGTISSKIDYRTGGVRPALTARDLYESVPELRKYASIEPHELYTEYSENITPEHWTTIAKIVEAKIHSNKYRGIIIAHGTDTMHYTAAALSFALRNLPIPVVIVGAQRSSDRPSSDAALNLLGASILATKLEVTGVFVAMHKTISDDVISCHMGTRVRKNHSSRRDAFESIDVDPVAFVKGQELGFSMKNSEIVFPKRTERTENMDVKANFDGNVALLKFYPGFDPRLIDYSIKLGNKIVILEGTGLGHVSKKCLPSLKNAISQEVLIFMTSQCIWGKTDLDVYDTGRDLLSVGVIPLGNMLTETATVKAMWALANFRGTEKIKEIMMENIANEITSRRTIG
jgi:glutamyl-tRNA(Gln) amidotransferase subunit D